MYGETQEMPALQGTAPDQASLSSLQGQERPPGDVALMVDRSHATETAVVTPLVRMVGGYKVDLNATAPAGNRGGTPTTFPLREVRGLSTEIQVF